jgi:hypothetical protein
MTSETFITVVTAAVVLADIGVIVVHLVAVVVLVTIDATERSEV